MPGEFPKDSLQGRPRILFVGFSDSSHTCAWIDLVRHEFNVRLFALPRGFPPDDWPVHTYLTQSTSRRFDASTRRKLYLWNKFGLLVQNYATRRIHGPDIDAPRAKLASVIKSWKPNIVHTLGLDEAGYFYQSVRNHFNLSCSHSWVLQLWGGSDVELAKHDFSIRPRIAEALNQADMILTDTPWNLQLPEQLELDPAQCSPIHIFPGTGGLNLRDLDKFRNDPPSRRLDILWPKAYECPWSKALPVLEALKICQDRFTDRQIYLLAADEQVRAWFNTLPSELRKQCQVKERIPRQELLTLMGKCRIMLAPSLVDGMPNSLYEAMALGAFPIVSPLKTITPVVRQEENVLFARNLYPEEIARALVHAMGDDVLVDAVAESNRKLVAQLADRNCIKAQMIQFYEELCDRKSSQKKLFPCKNGVVS